MYRWNSTVFATTSSNFFSYVNVRPSFLEGSLYESPTDSFAYACASQDYNLTEVIRTIYNGYKSGSYVELPIQQCFREYSSELLIERRNLILVSTSSMSQINNTVSCGFGVGPKSGSSVLAMDVNVRPKTWVTQFSDSPINVVQHVIEDTGVWTLGDLSIKYCLSESKEISHCRLEFTIYAMFAVVICNAIKLSCMCITIWRLWNLNEPVLATVGDAVASFLEASDPHTKGLCLLDPSQANKVSLPESRSHDLYDPIYRRERPEFLYFATSHTRWWLTIVTCSTYVLAGFVLWKLSLLLKARYSFSESMTKQFGAVDGSLVLGIVGESGVRLILDIMTANSFQLALSSTYFLYNSLYTAQCGALEWSRYFSTQKKGLRVTWPRGHQRSTFYLQLPYRYGIPLVVVSMVMHFLISQSVFLARLRYYNWIGERLDAGYTDVGFSPRAAFTSCVVGAVLVLMLILHSFRKLDNRMPAHGNKSTVISAMCHPPREPSDENKCADERYDLSSISTKKISWGVTKKAARIDLYNTLRHSDVHALAGHCNFSAKKVGEPVIGLHYR